MSLNLIGIGSPDTHASMDNISFRIMLANLTLDYVVIPFG